MKVGKYDIPTMRLQPILVEATKSLYEHFKSEEAPDQLTVAKLLGHKSERSGAFLAKLSDLRSYGLVSKRGVRVTDLGKKLTYDPSDQERNKALKEALLNVSLWKELYSRFGKNLPADNFWVELTKITGLEAPDAQKIEDNVRDAYLKDFTYVKEAEIEPMPEHGVEPTPKQPMEPTMELHATSANLSFEKKLPFTSEGIAELESLAKFLKTQLPKKGANKAKAGDTNEQ